MARVAGHAAGVLDGDHLRKRLGLRRVLLVAPDAERRHRGQLRNVRARVVSMLCQWSVTRLAGHVSVFAAGADLAFLVVAQYASALPGVGHGMLADGGQRAGPEMAVLAESLGNHGGSYHHKETQDGQQDDFRPNQMSRIPDELLHSNPPLREMRTLGRCTKATKRPYGLKLVLFGEIFNDLWRWKARALGEIAQSGVP